MVGFTSQQTLEKSSLRRRTVTPFWSALSYFPSAVPTTPAPLHPNLAHIGYLQYTFPLYKAGFCNHPMVITATGANATIKNVNEWNVHQDHTSISNWKGLSICSSPIGHGRVKTCYLPGQKWWYTNIWAGKPQADFVDAWRRKKRGMVAFHWEPKGSFAGGGCWPLTLPNCLLSATAA